MNELPPLVADRLRTLFGPHDTAAAVARLKEAAAELARRGAGPDHIERALIACLMAAAAAGQDDWYRDEPRAANDALAIAAGRVTTDTRRVLLDARVELTDWHTHLTWTPTGLPLRLDLPEPLTGLFAACATEYDVYDYGLSAYQPLAESIIGWATQHGGLDGLTVALGQLEAVTTTVAAATGPVHGGNRLYGVRWDTAADCLDYLDLWRAEAVRTLAAVGGAEALWPEWLTTTVRAIATGIVADRDFSRLPILADALEDVGCDSEPVLSHLRANAPHGWFCWIADLFAGR